MKRRSNFNINKLQRLHKSHGNQTRAVTSVLFICAGIALGEVGRYYGLSHPWDSSASALAQTMEPETKPAQETSLAASEPETEDLPETQPEEPVYEPVPDKLNLAYYFPEDSNSEDIINSYAGQVFQDLTIMDSQWLADIYELADIKPRSMAAQLGKSAASAIGSYNPKAENHDPEDPSTWTINDWKKIHVSFVNGDGEAVSGYSNVKDILAMASVYTYYTDLMDVETFEAYARQLWKDSHSYSLSMGNVYYCDGCMDKTDEEIAQEEEMEESDAAFLTADANRVISTMDDSAGSGAASFGSSGSNSGGSGNSGGSSEGSGYSEDSSEGSVDSSQENTVRIINSGKNYRPQSSGESASETEQDTAPNESRVALEAGAGPDLETDPTAPHVDVPAQETDSLQENPSSQTDALSQGNPSSQTNGAAQVGDSAQTAAQTGEGAAIPSQETEIQSTAQESGEVTVIRRNVAAQAAEQEAARYSSPSDPSLPSLASGSNALAYSAEVEQDIAISSQSAPGSGEHGTEVGSSGAGGLAGRSNDADASKSPHSHSDAKCPGHIDLYIRIRLLGLEDTKGLIAKDAIGNNQENQTADGWKGWTEENLASVRAICQQDWFADYGLSISAISTSTPLTAQEISEYMSQLPPDLSETRRKVIHFALSSVGKVPYYWGGKASHPGYSGNNFGMLISADDKGRMLRGLDCSGWISWVYWSATGTQLSGSSTSSLILCGEKISRSQLQPGDIIVRTGTNAHVVMFLSWSANGQMNVIHESSASVNNVTIKTMEAAWPYYRKLVD